MSEIITLLKDYLSKNWNNRQSISFLIVLIIASITGGLLIIVSLKYLIQVIGIPVDLVVIRYNLQWSLWVIKSWVILVLVLFSVIYWIKSKSLPKLKKWEVWIYLVPLFKDNNKIWTLESFIKNFEHDLNVEIWDISDIRPLTCPYYYNKIQELLQDHEESINEWSISKLKKVSKKFDELRLNYNVSYILLFECIDRTDWWEEIIQISKIRQIVIHASTHYYNQEILKKDLTLTIPKGFDISSNNEKSDIKKFMLMIWPHIAYIISITHFLKQDYAKCIKNAEKALYDGSWWKTKVYDRAGSIISQAYIESANELLEKMYKVWNFLEIETYLNTVKSAKNFKHSSYSTALMLWIGYFLKEFTTLDARRAIKKWLWPQTTWQEWLLSLAFLDLWDWKYDEAFKKINEINWDNELLSSPTMLKGILEFNEWVKRARHNEILDFWSAVVSKKMWNDSNFWYYQNNLKKINLPKVLKDYITELDA